MRPDVSVLMACLGATLRSHAERVRESWASVRGQEGPDWEMVVAVDGAVEGDAIRAYECCGKDPRVRVVPLEGPARGPGPARTAALEAARGAWITSIDTDDRYRPGRLARLVEATRDGTRKVVCDRTVRRGQDGGVQESLGRAEGWIGVDGIFRTLTPHAPLVERPLARGGWPDVPYCEDLVYMIRTCSAAGGIWMEGFVGVESVQHADGVSTAFEGARRTEAVAAFRTILEGLDTHGWGIGGWGDREAARQGFWDCLGKAAEGRM